MSWAGQAPWLAPIPCHTAVPPRAFAPSPAHARHPSGDCARTASSHEDALTGRLPRGPHSACGAASWPRCPVLSFLGLAAAQASQCWSQGPFLPPSPRLTLPHSCLRAHLPGLRGHFPGPLSEAQHGSPGWPGPGGEKRHRHLSLGLTSQTTQVSAQCPPASGVLPDAALPHPRQSQGALLPSQPCQHVPQGGRVGPGHRRVEVVKGQSWLGKCWPPFLFWA